MADAMRRGVPPVSSAQASARPATGLSAETIFSVVSCGIIAFLVVLPFAGNSLGMHMIPEGHVGVYYRGGALLKRTTNPGYHWAIPFITKVEPIQVTLQTDQVTNIPCGTKGGVLIEFEKIEVVNRLKREHVYDTILEYGVQYDRIWIYNKIHHEINQFCSVNSLQDVYIDKFDQIDERMRDLLQSDCTKYAPGIEILSVRVTKPRIPSSIARNYEIMEEEKTKVLVATERQRVVEKEAETETKRAVTEAEKLQVVSRIQMEQQISEKEALKRKGEIDNEIYLAKEKALTDAEFYKRMKAADANKLMLTPQYLELMFIQGITNNTKMFFGEKIPQMVYDQRLLNNYLQKANMEGKGDD